MDELGKLRAKKKRRQEALALLNEAEDRLQSLRAAFQGIETLASAPKARRRQILPDAFRFKAVAKDAQLTEIADRAQQGQVLAEIADRLTAIRSEFLTLAHADEAVMKELESLIRSQTK